MPGGDNDMLGDRLETILLRILPNVISPLLVPLRNDIGRLGGDIAVIKGDFIQVKEDIVQMKEDIVQMKEDTFQMKEDIFQIKGDMCKIQRMSALVGRPLLSL